MGLVFFGSGPVAARSLELLMKNFDIEAVVTKPKPQHHRGDFPVISLCEKYGLKMLATSTKSELDDLISEQSFESKVGVLIDFGIIVSKKVIEHFPLGIVNSHFSLLPEWRGPDPITFSVLSGQKVTGVSLMLLVEKMDEGPLLAQAEYQLPDTVTTPELTDKLIELSDAMLKEILPLYLDSLVHPAPQESKTIASSKKPTYSKKLNKSDGVIDWQKPAVQLEREVRAYQGWPGSRTKLAEKDVIITQASVLNTDQPQKKPGSIELIDNNIVVATSKGSLVIERLKPAGKREMSAREFIIGHKNKLTG
jgi:methionyl-tRNA formyltransferase